jgi:hypothetical protein
MARRKDGKPRHLPTDFVPMSKSGFCAFPSVDGTSHTFCRKAGCDCTCHTDN